MLRAASILLLVGSFAIQLVPSQERADRQPNAERIATYLPSLVRYAGHVDSLWHEQAHGGYWGDGRSAGNGGIRGTSNITLLLAFLVHAEDRGWLSEAQREDLAARDLDRKGRLARVAASWRFLAESHVTGGGACADGKPWGHSWQSSLWMGASGLAAWLVREDLDPEVWADITRVVVDEADHRSAQPPGDGKPGNTAAEENAWDTFAPAIALALFPEHDHALAWLQGAQRMAANTLSVAADRDSAASLGDGRVRDVVTTTNLYDDFTLQNHGFFHPSYLGGSVAMLGESLLMVELGDRRHGSGFAKSYRPYALHHVADAWQVLRRILMPDGDYAFPAGSDWTIHLACRHTIHAFVAGVLRDPVASLAERRVFHASALRTAASPPGRLLGATNLEWWWEPILVKRMVLAVLHLDTWGEFPDPADDPALRGDASWWSEPSGVLVVRRPAWFASVSTEGRATGLFHPLGEGPGPEPYVTTPAVSGLLPAAPVVGHRLVEHARGRAIVLDHAGGARSAMVALRDSVLWLADAPLGALGIQNDNVSPGGGRRLRWLGGERQVLPMQGGGPFAVDGEVLEVDGLLGLVAPGGFRYRPAGEYTRRSAAEDFVEFRGRDGLFVVQCFAGAASDGLELVRSAEGLRVVCRDGSEGPRVVVELDLATPRPSWTAVDVASDAVSSERSPLAQLADGDRRSFAVLTTDAGVGPTAAEPIMVEFSRPSAAGSATAVRLVPRPDYGPRRARLEVASGDGWQALGEIGVPNAPVEVQLGERGAGARRFRLVVTAGWDRGQAVDVPRNTQIAELEFVSTGEVRSDARPPLRVEVER